MKQSGTERSLIWDDGTEFGKEDNTSEKVLVSQTSLFTIRSDGVLGDWFSDCSGETQSSVQMEFFNFSISTRLALRA